MYNDKLKNRLKLRAIYNIRESLCVKNNIKDVRTDVIKRNYDSFNNITAEKVLIPYGVFRAIYKVLTISDLKSGFYDDSLDITNPVSVLNYLYYDAVDNVFDLLYCIIGAHKLDRNELTDDFKNEIDKILESMLDEVLNNKISE